MGRRGSRTSRRKFLGTSVSAGVGFFVAGSAVRGASTSPNEKLNVACIGVHNRGGNNLGSMLGENVVAICDVNEKYLDEASAKVPDATRYVDFRKLLDTEKSLDAVVVTTADHTHAVAAMQALKLGKHVYCEKPLTHAIWEARMLDAEAGKRPDQVTQMGNQHHSGSGYRKAVAWIRAGVIGDVREVHAWTDRPIWPQGVDAPRNAWTPEPSFHWDLWLGPAAERGYHPSYQPFRWRGWWDFGTGALGDMGCHILDPAYESLDLANPVKIEYEGPEPTPASPPKWSKVTYHVAERGDKPACTLTWYDGLKTKPDNRPPEDLCEGESIAGDGGSIYVGSKGKLFIRHGGQPVLMPADKFSSANLPEPEGVPGHHEQFILACKGEMKTTSAFAYSAKLTEFVLLGNLAVRAGKTIEWDAAGMKAKGMPELDPYIRPEYRSGWSL